ncbi:flavin reductase family protein [Mesorhizobium montanum]|uniref:flavin reductase family protein n=1 Tax=Mesorhizobium montanum TaxID=3072323 RepID=UPI002A23E63B|nr:flavin reductase family protein [Mesorhizobium sp. MSK_1335]
MCDPRSLRNAFGRFATGVTVVTTGGADGPVAITANSFSSVSLDPPLVLWSIGRHSRRFDAFANAAHYAIHVLAQDQTDLCWRFSKSGTDFADLDLSWNAHGVPLLARALARFECCVADRFAAGDHMILLGRVLELETQDGSPLLFAGGKSQAHGAV